MTIRTYDNPNHGNPTSVPIAEVLEGRWSPRGYDATFEVSDAQLTALMEAARWAPSSGNTQPTKFIFARRGTPEFERIRGTMTGYNPVWTERASLLVVAIAETERDGKPMRWAEYDLGQAMAHMSIEAVNQGIIMHQMGGFEVDALRDAFDIREPFVPVALGAIGQFDPSDEVPEPTRSRDANPRTRRPLEELHFRA